MTIVIKPTQESLIQVTSNPKVMQYLEIAYPHKNGRGCNSYFGACYVWRARCYYYPHYTIITWGRKCSYITCMVTRVAKLFRKIPTFLDFFTAK